MTKEYNITQLSPDVTFEKHVFHRDQFAHYLRWTHVLKRAKIGMNILDFGCGTGNLAEVLYRNRYKAKNYLGLEFKKSTVDKANEKYKKIDWVNFKQCDLVDNNLNEGNDWDIIVCFEVIEHVNKKNLDVFLSNIKKHCNENTTVLLSTPIFDEKVGAANNHIIDGVIQEYKYSELKNQLEIYFKVEDTFGTFASQKDYKPLMNEWQKHMFYELNKYYDSNLISNIMAPFFPKESRNCLWILKLIKSKGGI
jgi:2-polyprenyl-3-methyl-5-hydroxy-6-metoxy-1,4-benzoquinol methylase|tara:strand:- start:8092 stop:8844 length:753 start_codon:yes stop_codon:yes gene_type:complete